jgi:chromatin modification-related protein VID21
MQVDFREERRWKIAVAFELALCAQDWHAAESKDERIRLGICGSYSIPDPVDYQPPPEDEQVLLIGEGVDSESGSETSEDEDMADGAEETPITGAQGESDNDEEARDQRTVNDVLNPDVALANALEDAEKIDAAQGTAESRDQEPPEMVMKIEELDNSNALQLPKDQDSEMQMNEDEDPETRYREDSMKAEAMDPASALRDASANPLFDSQSVAAVDTPEIPQKEMKSLFSAEDTKRLRSSFLSLPEETLFVSMDQLLSMSDEELVKSVSENGNPWPVEFDPSFVFPELQPFSMQDVVTSDIVGGPSLSSDGRRRNDKKIDRDDPSRRMEETTYNKLYPASKFMHMKPTLISALEPARKWRKGKWVDLDDSPVVSDVDAPLPLISADTTSCEFYSVSLDKQKNLLFHSTVWES